MDWNEFLREAVAEKDVDLVRRALAQGADPNYPEPPSDTFSPFAGTTELFWAVRGGSVETVRLLLAAGANPTIEGWMRRTPLDKAQERKRGDGPHIYELLEQAAKRF